jgi:hypothetical protein
MTDELPTAVTSHDDPVAHPDVALITATLRGLADMVETGKVAPWFAAELRRQPELLEAEDARVTNALQRLVDAVDRDAMGHVIRLVEQDPAFARWHPLIPARG